MINWILGLNVHGVNEDVLQKLGYAVMVSDLIGLINRH